MRAGKLKHPITITRRVQMGVDAMNAPIIVDQTWSEPIAEVEVRRGREHFDSKTKQRYTEDVTIFAVRAVEVYGLTASMKISHQGNTYDIRSIRGDFQRDTDILIEATVQDLTYMAEAVMGYLLVTPPAGTQDEAYAGFTVSAKGGTAPYVFSVQSGSLPAGLSIDSGTGAVSGTPTAAGTYSNIVLRVTDANDEAHDLPAIEIVVA